MAYNNQPNQLGASGMYGNSAVAPSTPPQIESVDPYSSAWEKMVYDAAQKDYKDSLDAEYSRRGIWRSGQASSGTADELANLRNQIATTGAQGRAAQQESALSRDANSAIADKQIAANKEMSEKASRNAFLQNLLSSGTNLLGSYALNKMSPMPAQIVSDGKGGYLSYQNGQLNPINIANNYNSGNSMSAPSQYNYGSPYGETPYAPDNNFSSYWDNLYKSFQGSNGGQTGQVPWMA